MTSLKQKHDIHHAQLEQEQLSCCLLMQVLTQWTDAVHGQKDLQLTQAHFMPKPETWNGMDGQEFQEHDLTMTAKTESPPFPLEDSYI